MANRMKSKCKRRTSKRKSSISKVGTNTATGLVKIGVGLGVASMTMNMMRR